MFAESTSIFLADFGVPASLISAAGTWDYGDTSMTWANAAFKLSGVVEPQTYQGLALFDQADVEILGDRAISTGYEILFRTGDFPPLTADMQITVDGTLYSVIDSKKIDDGVFSRAMLEI